MNVFLDETLDVWQPYYEQELSQRDGEELVENWAAFINVVGEWLAQKEG